MLSSWLPTAVLVAAALSSTSHYAFWVRSEFDGILYRFMPGIFLLQGMSVMFLNYMGLTVIESGLGLGAIQTTYLVTLFASIALYRLFFHPTRIYPGPFCARLWSWWKIKAFIDHNEQGYAVFDELHPEYGDVIRIGWSSLPRITPFVNRRSRFPAGPRQISINDADAIADIYGSASPCFRSTYSEMAKEKDLQSLRDWDEHKARRKLWDQGLNAKGKALP